jgi:hypothetical protein
MSTSGPSLGQSEVLTGKNARFDREKLISTSHTPERMVKDVHNHFK